MILPRKGWGKTVDETFDLPAFKLEGQSVVNAAVLAEFVEELGPVSLADIEKLKRCYASLIIQINRLRPALASADVLARPENGGWSIKEMLGYFVDTDREVWWPRIEAILRDEYPSFADIDPLELARAHDWQSQPLDEILSQLVRSRWDYAMKLNDISPAEFERSGEHAVLGNISILRILQILVAHDDHYLHKIRARIESLAADLKQ